MNGAMAMKALILLGAFPVTAHAIFTAMTMLLDAVLASLQVVGDWSTLTGKVVIVGSLVCAVRCSFLLCRRLWPAGLATSESA